MCFVWPGVWVLRMAWVAGSGIVAMRWSESRVVATTEVRGGGAAGFRDGSVEREHDPYGDLTIISPTILSHK